MKTLPPTMPTTVDRRPYFADHPESGYLESDDCWCDNNREAVTWFIDNHHQVRAAVEGSAEMLGALNVALSVLDDVRGNINPERGFADELEADISKALRGLCTTIAKYDRGAS